MRLYATKIAFAAFCMTIAAGASAAEKFGPKVRLTCAFPAAETVQKVKPGKTNVSDGVVRIAADKFTFDICNGCRWQKSKAKWKVSATRYQLNTGHGIELDISRQDGSALFVVTSQEDEYYFAGRAESRGQCNVAAKKD